jgi:dolichol-phosphate mannosyltransferase
LRIAVIIPTYNEAENLPLIVSALLSLPLDLLIYIVDDNSPDGTGLLADQLAEKHAGAIRVAHRSGRMGLSTAYLEAMSLLRNEPLDAIAQMDADFSHQPEKLVEMEAKLHDCDLVVGSRYIPGGSTDSRWPFWRKALSAWGSFYARVILGLPFKDLTGGFRLWRCSLLQSMPLERVKSRGYVFQVEMLHLAWCMNARICEIPIHFADRRMGKSKMSFKIQLEAALRVWQVLWAYRDLHRPRSGGNNR